jgi:hypothetical protein
MKLALTLAVVTLSLAGCGTIGNVVTQDQTLQRRAAFALNTTPEKVTITNREGDVDSIHFVATVGKDSYQCYVASVAGVQTSDAICSGSNSVKPSSTKGSAQCNALLKAAGRC